MRAPTGGIVGLGDHERGAVPVVESGRDVTRELEVLTLVVADGHEVGVVGEDVGRHEHRVVEQARRSPTPARPTCP